MTDDRLQTREQMKPRWSDIEAAIVRIIRAIPQHSGRNWIVDPIQESERDWARPLAAAALAAPPTPRGEEGLADRADLMADEYCGAHHDDLTPAQQIRWTTYREGCLAGLLAHDSGEGWFPTSPEIIAEMKRVAAEHAAQGEKR